MGITDNGIRTKEERGKKRQSEAASVQAWTISCMAMSSNLERHEGVFSETQELKCIMESRGRSHKKDCSLLALLDIL